MKTYSEKRRDPRWQKKRLKILNRDNFQCVDCCDGESPLNVHHRYYISGREPWEYPDWSLRSLCENCHQNRHSMEIRREEGFEIPNEDPFESVFRFLGAGDDITEGMIWDIATEASQLQSQIGGYAALSRIMHAIHQLRKETEI